MNRAAAAATEVMALETILVLCRVLAGLVNIRMTQVQCVINPARR